MIAVDMPAPGSSGDVGLGTVAEVVKRLAAA
jgi:hypothetical protein